MTANSLRPPLPSHLLPGKALATSQGTNLSATATSTPSISRSSSHTRLPKVARASNNADFASEKATSALIRRWLCSSATYGDTTVTQKPIEDLLPPLSSSNEVDLQMYGIIAVIIKDFVSSWYTKITPDHVFVDEVVHIIAHCTRALEQRLRTVDIAELILDEIPAIVDTHIQATRTANATTNSSPYNVQTRRLYHQLNAHPALDPVPGFDATDEIRQAENEATYRQLLMHGALAILLPTEDLENICLRTLVADVIADLILGQGIGGKACQPWFIWDAITKIVQVARARIEPKATGEEIQVDTRSKLEKFGLLSSKNGKFKSDSPIKRQSRISALFWRVLQYTYLSCLFIRFLILGLSHARSASPRAPVAVSSRSIPVSPIQTKSTGPSTPTSSWSVDLSTLRRPVLDYRLFSMMARLLDLSTRMPWLLGSLSWCQHSIVAGAGRLGDTDGILDRFLSQTIRTYILPSSLLSPLLYQARINIFPNNSLGPPAPPPPSPEEQLALRRKCAEGILSLIPDILARTFFNVPKASPQAEGSMNRDEGKEDMILQIEEILDLFGDAYLNKHLIYGILETILLKLIPELAERTPRQLYKERIGGEDDDDDADLNK